MKEQLLRAFPRDSKVESDEESPFIEVKNCQKEKTQAAWPWIASTIVLTLVLICDIVQRGGQDGQCLIKTRPAFRTDLKDSHPHIELEERVFSGRLWFDKDTETVYRDIDPSEPQYFGPPSPEIDAAWSDLLRGKY